ncbi:PREDICTED: collagenase-like [Nicrophorus vespilloides]|uniref:Collagenase-like n=1 Tax=Nicrophorus vespilloides TaxID=110193 RepID=A0ABM1M7Q4_NICVS|nr:PREDICTED: collagenase-like [Nicrophorus vespilloides]
MFVKLSLLLAVCLHLSSAYNGRIINGYEASIGQFAHAVAVKKGITLCGGSILDETTILTSARCVYKEHTFGLTVVAGTINRYTGGESRDVSHVIVHEKFDPETFDNDIAILKLFYPYEFDHTLDAIRLPVYDTEDDINVMVSGYTHLDYNPNLEFAYQRTIGVEECQSLLPENNVTGDDLCTVSAPGVGLCTEDFGNGLVDNKGYLLGISRSDECDSDKPDVYLRVYSYLDWIKYNRA